MAIQTADLTRKTLKNSDIPDDVIIRSEARKPEMDPTLGIPVTVNAQGTPRHRLVTLGDSLTHGFQSGAIYNTGLSYPMLIAREMGWAGSLRFPTYGGPGKGLPLNLEDLARQLERKFGNRIDVWELALVLLFLRDYLDRVEDYWERGAGAQWPTGLPIYHNLAVYGWDLRNTLARTAEDCLQAIAATPTTDDWLKQTVQNHNDRAAMVVLNTARTAGGTALTPVAAAAVLGAEGTVETGTGDGIETLLVLIGANNALGSILTFKVVWSGDDYADMDLNDQYTVWRPIHFQAELDLLVEAVQQVQARHVIWGTVPHVTIAPLARGVTSKVQPGSRYYPYYTLPWITDAAFNPDKHPHLTADDARAIDSAIDQYNDAIAQAVRTARQQGCDWYLFETAGLLDRLAAKRYLEDPAARPSWWEEVGGAYPLPAPLQALDPIPDSQFFIANARGRQQGGLFSLDGIHPTTIGYGILAQELIKVMELAQVKFYDADGITPRPSPIEIDFQALIARDTLIADPPNIVESVLEWIGGVDSLFSLFTGLLQSSYT